MNHDETIEEWMEQVNHEYRDIRDLELAEGLQFADMLRRLVEIAKDDVFNELVDTFPITLQPLGTKRETQIPKWKAIKAVGILVREMQKRHLSTSVAQKEFNKC